MKRRLTWGMIMIGLTLWLWVGSYVYFRATAPSPFYRITFVPIHRFIEIPAWVESIGAVYRPLIAIDYYFTGERIQFGSVGRGRIQLGATADF